MLQRPGIGDMRRDACIDVCELCRQRPFQDFARNRKQQTAAGNALVRHQHFFTQRMAEQHETHVAHHIDTPCPEQRPPLVIPQQLQQLRIGGQHDHPTLVKQGQRITHCATAAVAGSPAVRKNPRMARIQGRLGPRKRQPDQHIEEIVPAALPVFQFPPHMQLRFIRQIRPATVRRHQSQR